MLLPASDNHATELKSQGSTVSGEAESRQTFGATAEEIEAQRPFQEDRDSSSASRNHRNTVALLVDANRACIFTIKATLKALQGHGKLVSITIFANAHVAKNARWREFIEQYGIRFKAVSRNGYGIGDPNDIEISREAHRLTSTQFSRIALLVYDADFIPLVEDLQKLGKEPIVILPDANQWGRLAWRFERMEVPVLIAEPNRSKGKGRVSAILEADGTGKIYVKVEDFEYPYVDADT
mgnify:CR=1 FL=1